MGIVIYARYSAGSRQTDQSIDGQIRVCTEYAKLKGLTIIGEYCDKHISGKTDERPEFQRLIADAKLKKFEAVLVYKTDRFARNKYDSAIYKKELKKNGIQIFYAAEAIPDGPEGIILESLMEGLAEYYSVELAQKVRRGMRESALKCKSTGGNIPLGYKVDKDKNILIDDTSAPIVQAIFQKYINGTPNSTICDYLNSRGFRTSQGNLFNKNSIHRIIQNRSYIGEYKYSDILIQGGMPAIMDLETFNLAQQERAKRKQQKKAKAPKAEYTLAGKMFCGYCKAPLHGISGTGRSGEKYYYYTCANTRGKEKTCHKANVKRDWLESTLVEFIKQQILQKETLENIVTNILLEQNANNTLKKDIAFYEKKLIENKRAHSNILKMIEFGNGTKSLTDRLQQLEDERTVLENELTHLKKLNITFTDDQLIYMLLSFLDKYEYETEQEYNNRILTCFLSEVYLFDDHVVLFFNISSPDGKLKECDFDIIKASGSTKTNSCSTASNLGGAGGS